MKERLDIPPIEETVGEEEFIEEILDGIDKEEADLAVVAACTRDQTDDERMNEAFLKYACNPRVEHIIPMRVRRQDGSMYVTPLVKLMADQTTLTASSLIYPGGGSIASPY